MTPCYDYNYGYMSQVGTFSDLTAMRHVHNKNRHIKNDDNGNLALNKESRQCCMRLYELYLNISLYDSCGSRPFNRKPPEYLYKFHL